MILNLASVRTAADLDCLAREASWPMQIQEHEALFGAIERVCRDLFLRATDPAHDRILRIILPLLQWAAFNVAYADCIVRRMRAAGNVPTAYTPSHADYFSWLLGGGSCDPQIVRAHLTKYANVRNWLLHAPRRLRSARASTYLLTSNITVEQYLATEHLPFTRSFVDDWLPLVINGRTMSVRYLSLVRDITGALDVALATWQSSRAVSEWIRAFVADGVYCIASSFDALARSTRVRRTRVLYTATQGYIGTRCISQAVREHGGAVYAFPHTGGLTYVVPHTWMIETLTCSTFMCYTPWEQELRQEQLRAVGGTSYATLSLLPSSSRHALSAPAEFRGSIRRVCYLGAGYPGDRFFVDVLPEALRLTLEVRIIDALVRRGLDVTVKCHRKSRSIEHLIALFRERYGAAVTIDTTPLTDLLRAGDLHDAYVAENLGGGSFVEVIKTTRPVILISPHLHFLHPAIRDALLRRVSYIPCTFDVRGAPTFDVPMLDAVLDRPTHPVDDTFVRRCTHESFAY